MQVVKRSDDYFVIKHAGKEVDAGVFKTEAEAWAWADANIDDQMFDLPNWLSEPLKYRTFQ